MPVAAVDNPEATLELKELSSALWKLSPQSREALILVGRRRLFLRGGSAAVRLLGRHPEGPRFARAKASCPNRCVEDTI